MIYHNIQPNVPYCTLFAGDIVLITESKDEVYANFIQWRVSLEANRLYLRCFKTDYCWANFNEKNDKVDDAVYIAEGRVLEPTISGTRVLS